MEQKKKNPGHASKKAYTLNKFLWGGEMVGYSHSERVLCRTRAVHFSYEMRNGYFSSFLVRALPKCHGVHETNVSYRCELPKEGRARVSDERFKYLVKIPTFQLYRMPATTISQRISQTNKQNRGSPRTLSDATRFCVADVTQRNGPRTGKTSNFIFSLLILLCDVCHFSK